ncbi:hypothetical protein E2562_017179 [Oryza meyeriana var. granulata]|uniref:Uncharacterized protein n=1 Tax=Oryza meyeriana var. granulata TaxID=110450 RepID=A0A6G1ELY9_9ORYZ|nr:hypothetical protein E2562_017179 [Oryza meyeriana var. granulata]
MPEEEYAPVPLGQAPEAVDPEDPVKSPPRPSSPATSTRKVRIGLSLLPLLCSSRTEIIVSGGMTMPQRYVAYV